MGKQKVYYESPKLRYNFAMEQWMYLLRCMKSVGFNPSLFVSQVFMVESIARMLGPAKAFRPLFQIINQGRVALATFIANSTLEVQPHTNDDPPPNFWEEINRRRHLKGATPEIVKALDTAFALLCESLTTDPLGCFDARVEAFKLMQEQLVAADDAIAVSRNNKKQAARAVTGADPATHIRRRAEEVKQYWSRGNRSGLRPSLADQLQALQPALVRK